MPNRPPNARANATRKPWDHKKTAEQRGYGREYRRLRAELLKREPLCRYCLQKRTPVCTPATQVDHILSIAKGGAAHDIDNLAPCCFECHSAKSAREKGHRVRVRIGPSGWPEV